MKVFRPGIATLVALSMLVAACAKAPDNLQATLQNYVDRQAIETTLVRYSTGLDTFDADVYASAFAEDAEFAMEGKVFKGRAEISKIITDLNVTADCNVTHRAGVKVDHLGEDGGFGTAHADSGASSGDTGIEAPGPEHPRDCAGDWPVARDGAAASGRSGQSGPIRAA